MVKSHWLVIVLFMLLSCQNNVILLTEEYYENGNVKRKTTFNKLNKMKTVVEYWESGEKIYEAKYMDTILIGNELYSKDGGIMSEKKIYNHINDGITVFYDTTGVIKSIVVGESDNMKEYEIIYDSLGSPHSIMFSEENIIKSLK